MIILGVSFVVFMILLALFKIAPSMENSNNNGIKHQGLKKNRYNNKYFDNQLYTSKINYLIDNLLNYAIKEDVFYLLKSLLNTLAFLSMLVLGLLERTISPVFLFSTT